MNETISLISKRIAQESVIDRPRGIMGCARPGGSDAYVNHLERNYRVRV
jgi:hypothetical protein